MADDEWRTEWQPMIYAVGQDFGGEIATGRRRRGEALVRRFVEPLVRLSAALRRGSR